MNWNDLFDSVNDALEGKYQKLEGDMRRKVRGFGDSQLRNAYNSGKATAEGEEILEDEMRRRGLL